MKDNTKEHELTYALDSSGKMVSIDSVERGLACNCRCPKCNKPLVAKLGHEGGRRPHFAHSNNADCGGAYMSALHRLAEQIIEENKEIMAPTYKGLKERKLQFDKVEVEQRVTRNDLQPDVVGITHDGLRWAIEIRNTHEIKEDKRNKIVESGITCLEIDVREQLLEDLKTFLLESVDKREWIFNPNYEKYIEEIKRQQILIIEKYLLDNQEIAIPAVENYESTSIIFQNAMILSKSDDGLFVSVKGYSSDGIPYIFSVGDSERLAENRHLSYNEQNCNELSICTDGLSLDESINVSNLDIIWECHYISKNNKENKLKKYRNNPKYKVETTLYCIFDCEYKFDHGECIYAKEIIPNEGGDYVVCDIEKKKKDKAETENKKRENDSQSVLQDHLQSSKKQAFRGREISFADELPFTPNYTLKDYYMYLQSEKYYDSEVGGKAIIVRCEMACGKIVVLYKRNERQFHISMVSSNDGKLYSNKVADFCNAKQAMLSFIERINILKKDEPLKLAKRIEEQDLPF